MTDDAATLSASERAQLDLLGDVLIPSAGSMPSVSESDLNGHWLDRACRARPDLVPALRALLASHPDLRSLEEIARLEKEGEPGIAALVTLNAGRYYMNPKIRELIGYPGQGGRDPSLPEYGWDRAADLLERVVGRGPIYREAH